VHQLRRPRGGLLAALGAALILMIGSLVAAPASALDGETRLHDPSIIKAGGCYYAYTTGFENDPANPSGSIMIYRTCQSTPTGG
jgi:arabinan endo-1,5-alpha-L-arabinosidase